MVDSVHTVASKTQTRTHMQQLDERTLTDIIQTGLAQRNWRGQRVLVLIPDGTRTMPMPRYFALVRTALRAAGATAQTWMVALGTHPAMDDAALSQLLGVDVRALQRDEPDIRVVNHAWQDPVPSSSSGRFRQPRCMHSATA